MLIGLTRTLLPVALLVSAVSLTACIHDVAEGEAKPVGSTLLAETPLVDTRPWLTPVAHPPATWRRVVASRKGVRRHRFVRFERPHRFPAARGRFLIQPFPDARLILRMRRAGPVKGIGYSWFGMFEHDPRGFGGIVVRPSGRVSVDVKAPDGRRFQVANVGNGGYAILEVEPEGTFECAESVEPERS